ncbi:Sec-independent protein translocase subunit TatA [Saccharopolyspora sp. NPDC002376]
MGLPGGWELILIVLVVVLLFGATKLPQMARSLGQSARVFKAEARGMKADEEAAKKSEEDKAKPELTSGESSTPPVASPSPADEKQRNDKN